jgi:hypothetical protein
MFRRRLLNLIPGDFNFIKDEYWRSLYHRAYGIITDEELWTFLKNENPPWGMKYTNWKNHNVSLLMEKCSPLFKEESKKVDFEMVIRTMEYIAKYGWNSYLNKMCIYA